MKGLIELLFGGDTYEIMAKGGLAGGALGALKLTGTSLEKLIHLMGGLFSSVFLGPIIFELTNHLLSKIWKVELSNHAIVMGIGFLVGYLGVDGLFKLWEKWKLASLLRKVLFFLLTNKENENKNGEA